MKKLIILLGLAALIALGLLRLSRNHVVTPDLQAALGKSNIVPVLIIGSGPAGLTAALYTARAHMPTVVITGNDVGGQLTEARYVENWPAMRKETGAHVMLDLEKQVRHFGGHIVEQEVRSIDFAQYPYKVVLSNEEELHALSVIIATGGKQKKLPIEGVDEFWGNGIGVCTICDAPFDKNKEVCIVGTSDYMCDMALQLKEFAKKVRVLVPRERMDAAAVNVQYLEDAPNIGITYNVHLDKLEGDNGKLARALYTDKATGKQESIPCESFYFAIGFKPQTDIFKGKITLDKDGYVDVDPITKVTSSPLVYAAGNVIDRRYQKGLVAAAAGAESAIELIEALQGAGFTDALEDQLKPNFYRHSKPEEVIEKVAEDADLSSYVRQDGYVVVEFYGQNCPVCKAMGPVVQECAQAHQAVKWYKFDIQSDHAVIDHYEIDAIPTFILFKDGKELERTIGSFSQDDFCALVHNLE